MKNTTLIKYWVAVVLALLLTVGLFMIVPTALEANDLYQTTKQIDKATEQIEYNSNKRLELETEQERLNQKNKELREEQISLENKLLGKDIAFTK